MRQSYHLSARRRHLLAGAALMLLPFGTAQAADQPAPPAAAADDSAAPAEADQNPDIIVTATRREMTLQSAPINISAVTSEQLQAQGIGNLREVTRQVPGIYIPDNGGRSGAPIIFRGLNANPLGSGDGNNDGGGTVATYVGEVPLYVDLRLNDIDRVEFLAGPQGTLYGAGTMGGAIRYIPNKPKFGETTLDTRGEIYRYEHGGDASYSVGATLNVPITDTLAFRASLDWLDDKGFIDQPYVVNNIGVSNPDPNFSDPADVAQNVHRVNDVNNDRVLSGRAALRWQPTATLDATLTYYFQQEDTRGRQASSQVVSDFPVPVGRYDNLKRVLEPNRRINHLLALEVSADLGFATLTSSTGRSWFNDNGHRDQTDLLIGLEYSYEAFPTFTAYTDEKDHTDTFTQEVRLVSANEGPFSWIVGGFYNKTDSNGSSMEITPNYSDYLVNTVGTPGVVRPDDLEYYSVGISHQEEIAGYGELSFKVTPKWTITAGGRYYHYNLKTQQAVDTPLFYSTDGDRGPNDIELDFEPGGQSDSGFLYKFNTSYQFTPTIMAYFTASQGYRIGNSNGLALCPVPLPPNQNVCAQPNELQYKPDKTDNYELGVKTQWFDRRLTLNASIYDIEWSDPQIASATQIGLQPITVNGKGARSRGFELAMVAQPTPRLTVRANYAYTDPKLTELAPALIPEITPPGFQSTIHYLDGEPGDRLPGSPNHSGNLYVEYKFPIFGDKSLALGYNLSAQSDVLTSTGGRGGSYTLPAFSRSDISARLIGPKGNWSVTAYIDNLFDDFSQTGASSNPNYNQSVSDDSGGVHYVRTFYTYVLPPRSFGLRFEKKFGH